MNKHWQQTYAQLPDTRKDVDWKNRVVLKLPSLTSGDAYTELLSKEEVKEWMKDFISKYKEEPKLVNKGDKIEVTNQKFKDYQNQYTTNKAGALKDFRTTDENKIPTMKKSEAKNFIKEQIKSSLLEKKKSTKKDDEVLDVSSEEDFSSEDTGETAPTNEVDPNIKAIQTHLTKAQEAANALGDQKLITQIGNSLTYFTRAHVSKTEVSE